MSINISVGERLSNELLYLFNNGKLYHAYRSFGAQLQSGGVQFTVWAPDVRSVKVVGDFNSWGMEDPEDLPFSNEDCYLECLGDSGVFTGFLPGLTAGYNYKYDITTFEGEHLMKADPFAFGAELRPGTASVITDLSYEWGDDKWIKSREKKHVLDEPMNIYEMHLGSWMRHPNVEDGFYSYDELADKLIPYIKEMGYTHVEFMPVMEHPLDASWGYQVTGYFAATARFGKPVGLMRLIDKCHQNGIGVILDWVPGHFCPDEQGLALFNGKMLYESEIHPDWGTYKFNFARSEVRTFLLSNAMFWLEQYHVDGLRVDGVSSMLYLNFGKSDKSTYIYNKYGEEIDLDAVSFIREFNEMVGTNFPGAFTAAEESSAYPLVTMPPDVGGLGFHFKWNMGWMNDTLDFMSTDFIYRGYDHNKMTFSMSYAYSENYILPLSHDEVVHGKKSLLGRMPGGLENQFAGLRTLTMFQMTHPGKKLNFMGHENAPFIEWREYEELEWFMLKYENHAKYRDYIKAMNRVYCENEALWKCDTSWDGFQWIDPDNSMQNVLSYVRFSGPKSEEPKEASNVKLSESKSCDDERQTLVVVMNLNVQDFEEYRIGVPEPGDYKILINTDDEKFGGKQKKSTAVITADEIPMHGQQYSIEFKLPPLGSILFKRIRMYKDGKDKRRIR